MVDHSTSEKAHRDPDQVPGTSREFRAAPGTWVGAGALTGALCGVLGAALLIWAVPADHWARDSWWLVGAGYVAFMAVVMGPGFLVVRWVVLGGGKGS